MVVGNLVHAAVKKSWMDFEYVLRSLTHRVEVSSMFELIGIGSPRQSCLDLIGICSLRHAALILQSRTHCVKESPLLELIGILQSFDTLR